MKRILFLLAPLVISPAQADKLCYDTLSKAMETGDSLQDVPALIEFDIEMVDFCNRRDELLLKAIKNKKEIEQETSGVTTIVGPPNIVGDENFFENLDVLSAQPQQQALSPVITYSVVTTFGTSQKLQAIVTDGAQTWTVQPGSKLPGEITVASVKPHEVVIRSNKENHTLGWKSQTQNTEGELDTLLSGGSQ